MSPENGTGVTTNGSMVIVHATGDWHQNDLIVGPGIPPNARLLGVEGSVLVVNGCVATRTASGVPLCKGHAAQ